MGLSSRMTGLLLAFILLAGFVGCGRKSPRQQTIRDNVLERFPVATDGGLLLLPVTIQEKRFWFALDTGATHCCYDNSLRSLLGEPIGSSNLWTLDKDITVPIFRSPAGWVGKLALPADSRAIYMDLEKIREVTGQEIHGILGMDFLSKHVFRIDLDQGEVTFLRNPGPNAGQSTAVQSNRLHWLVAMDIPGLDRTEQFLMDTGLSGFGAGGLQTEAFAALTEQGKLTRAGKMKLLTASGIKVERLGQVDAVSLSGFRHEKLIFNESKMNVLGLGYWSRYVATFDFRLHTIYLKKGRRFDQPDLCNWSGLHLLRIKGRTVVDFVDKGSPAEEIGIHPRDVLLRIDEANVCGMSLDALRRRLCDEGKKYRLRIQRGQNEFEKTIVLRKDKP